MMFSRIRRAIAFHGIAGVIKLSMESLWQKIIGTTPSQLSAQAASQARDADFDELWGQGMDTGGIILPKESEVVGSNWIHGVKYRGSDSAMIERLLESLSIQHEQFTFVDLGSGKGRVMLMASRFPFKSIIGVEYSQQLNDIAKHNISRFPNHEMQCSDIDLVS